MPTDLLMLLLPIYTFAVFGLAYIVGHSVISVPVRDRLAEWGGSGTLRSALGVTLVTMLECPACFSTWVGGIVGIFAAPHLGWPRWIAIIALACYSAATSLILGKLTRIIG